MSIRWLIDEFKKDWRKKPNIITLVRLIFGLVPAVLLSTGSGVDRIVAFFMFIFLINTDWVDGYVARRFNEQTEIGRIMDPVADRLITGSVLIALMFGGYSLWLEVIFAWLLMAAVLISVLLFKAKAEGMDTKPNVAGKQKTVFLSALIICLIGERISWFGFLSIFSPTLAVITLMLSVISFFEYIKTYSNP